MTARRPVRSEKVEQQACMRLLRTLGFSVYNLSQARASQQTPGLPDLWAADPQRGIALWWETKRQGGRLRPEQVAFAHECGATGTLHGHGPCDALMAWLESLGYGCVLPSGGFQAHRGSHPCPACGWGARRAG